MGVAMRYGTPSDAAQRRGGWRQVWENGSPTSNFAAQTVDLDLSGASEIRIEYRLSTTSETRCFTDGFINGQALPVTGMSNLSSTTAYLLIRNATPSATGVVFQTAYRRSTVATTSASSSPGYMIPVAIYVK